MDDHSDQSKWEALSPEPDPSLRSVRKGIITAAVVAVAIGGYFVIEYGLPGQTSDDVILRDDFEDRKNFDTYEDATASRGYANGGYEISIKDPAGSPQESVTTFEDHPESSLSFAVDATIVGNPRQAAIGLSCWQSSVGNRYLLAVSGNGEYVLAKNFEGRQGEVLTTGQTDPLDAAGSANRISVTCRGGEGRAAVLQLFVNGKEVARHEDPDGFDSFIGVGLFMAAERAGTLVRFDNALLEGA